MLDLIILDIPIDHKNKLIHKSMTDQVYDLIHIFYELLSSKEKEIKKLFHNITIYNNFAIILLNHIKRQTFTPWLCLLKYLCNPNDHILVDILNTLDLAFENSVISIAGLSLRVPGKSNSFIPKRDIKQLNDAKDEGLRVFLYMSCIKNIHIYQQFPNNDCPGYQLILSLFDNKDDITALLSTRSILVLLVSLTNINDEYIQNTLINILENCLNILTNLNIKFHEKVITILNVKDEYDKETNKLNNIENEFITELSICSDGRNEDNLDQPLSYYLESNPSLNNLYNIREDLREKTLELRLRFNKLGETGTIVLKRLRVLFLLITRILIIILKCDKNISINNNTINNNTKEIHKIYEILKQQDWLSIMSINRLEFRLFDISCAELLFSTLSLYFPYFQEIFLESIYDAMVNLVDSSIKWYDAFESNISCTLATRIHVALCIWGCNNNKLVKERLLDWKSSSNNLIYLKLLYNNNKIEYDDKIVENQDGKFDNVDLVVILEDQLHKGHLMVQHNQSMLSTCQERLHCACCEIFTTDLNDLMAAIFTSPELGGTKVIETHPLELLNYLLCNPIDRVNPHIISQDIHNQSDLIMKIVDSSTSLTTILSKSITTTSPEQVLFRVKVDMLAHLIRGGFSVLHNPAISEPNNHLLLLPKLPSYSLFFNKINSDDNRIYTLMQTSVKIIYNPSSIRHFIGNGFLGKSTYQCVISFIASIAALGSTERGIVEDCMKITYHEDSHLWVDEEDADENYDVAFILPLILILHGGIINELILRRFPHVFDHDIDDSIHTNVSEQNTNIIISILELLMVVIDTNENLKRQLLLTQGTFISKTLLDVLSSSSSSSSSNQITVLVIRLAISLSTNNEFRVSFGQKGFPLAIQLFSKSTIIVEKIMKFEVSSLSSDAMTVLLLSRGKSHQYSSELLLALEYNDMMTYYDDQRIDCCIHARNLGLISSTYINLVNDGIQLNVMQYPDIFKYLQSNLMRLTPSTISMDISGFHAGIARQACILLQKIAYRNTNGQKLIIETGCINGLIACLNEVSGSEYEGSLELRNAIIDCVEKLVTYSNPLLLEMIQKSCGVLGLLQLMYNGSSHIRVGIITCLLEKCSKNPKIYDEIIVMNGIRMIYGVIGSNDTLVQANGLRLLKMLLIKKDARLESMEKPNINVLSNLLNSTDNNVRRNAVEVLGILSSDDADAHEMHKILRNSETRIVDKIRDISSDSFTLPRARILPTLDIEQYEREKLESSSPMKTNNLLFKSPNADMFPTKTKSSNASLVSNAEREFRSTNLTAANVLAQFSDIEETIWPDGNPEIYKGVLKLGLFPKIEQ